MGEQNITTMLSTAAKETTVETKAGKVNAESVTLEIQPQKIAELVEGYLTTAEHETGSDTGDIKTRLLTVKSLVTLTLTLCFAYLSATGEIASEQFLTIFTTVIAFYFGVQTVKGKE